MCVCGGGIGWLGQGRFSGEGSVGVVVGADESQWLPDAAWQQ